MDFVAIDFETANRYRSSACSIGIAEYKNGTLVSEVDTLINPEEDFEPFNISIHNITPEMVKDKPTFAELWPDINHYFKNTTIIAHNAAFDISVLRHCLDKYYINYPDFNYLCTYLLSKRLYTELPNYRLDYLVYYFGLPEFSHHRAIDDAVAAGDLFLNITETTNVKDYQTLAKEYKFKLGSVISSRNDYTPFTSRVRLKRNKNPKEIVPTVTDFDINHPFYDKNVIFTGTLSSMSRNTARQVVVDVGGICGKSVTMKCNYLVVGIQDYSKFKDGKKSSKMKRAEELAQRGLEIEIITEDDFLKIL